MPTFDALEDAWNAAGPEPREGAVRLICVRRRPGEHETPDRVRVTPEDGVEGDRWRRDARGTPGNQVTLMSARVAALVADGRVPLHMAGDTFLVDFDLSEAALPVGARVALGGIVLEVSDEPHAGCRKFRARFGDDALRWVNHPRHRERRLRGVNCRVIAGGEVALGDPVARL
jgi:MOSC domain-containing protein YiiM